ncbi:mucin-5AC [Drosophila subobscura]|uniref:mucin-5AC n=1 Tax=Drosophila subobscura TaxID=7241 RepID=UPI00155A9F66|nr:mucin-5AC [Drosophila subobscura]
MYAKVCVLLLAVGLSQAFVQEPVVLPQEHLMRLVMQSRDLGSDSSHTMDCLAYYVPAMNAVSEQFDTDTKLCLSEAQAKAEAIKDATQPNRTAIEDSGTSSCSALNACSNIQDAESYFKCTAAAGSDNAKSMFTISANSNELVSQIQETTRQITVWQYDCTNQTAREYAENSAVVYESMNACLAGADVPTTGATPDPTTASTPAPTTESTAEPSTESTAAPSTESTAEPSTESSAAPSTESTAAPSTESTAAPSTESTAAPSTESTAAPSTESTAAPSTESTAAPSTESTAAPSTEPTAAPSTESTAAPSTESTAAPSTEASTTENSEDNKESAPEEDLSHLITSIETKGNADVQQILKNIQQWLKRF